MEQIGENKYRVRKSKAVLCGSRSTHMSLTGESNLTHSRLDDSTLLPMLVIGRPEPVGHEIWSFFGPCLYGFQLSGVVLG